MILEKAYYQQNYQVGQFLFTNYGLGAFIEEGETHQEVYAQLKERVHAQFMADNPHLQSDISAPLPPEPIVLPEIKIERIEGKSFIEQIMSSETLDDLKGWSYVISGKHDLIEAYNTKLKELSK